MTASVEYGSLTVQEAGETRVLAAVFASLRAHERQSSAPFVIVPPGDDAAVLRLDGDAVVTSDAMVDGVDFSMKWCTAPQLGWKLAATNLSDLAAMGAVPAGLTVTVFAPVDTTVRFLEEVSRGLAEACAELAPGCRVIGGDLSTSRQLAFSITAIGAMGDRTPVTRSGAQPGDVLAYAGDLGLAGAGLRILSSNDALGRAKNPVNDLWLHHTEELSAHLTPAPPVTLGPVAADAGATAMMDVSDSLSLDAARLGAASNVTLNLSASHMQLFISRTSIDDVLFGGEDHGLLATFPPTVSLPSGFVQIGWVQPRTDELQLDGAPISPVGWDPFASSGIRLTSE